MCSPIIYLQNPTNIRIIAMIIKIGAIVHDIVINFLQSINPKPSPSTEKNIEIRLMVDEI